ncbi:MAG: hypothetical protein A2284_03790 [Deltaproteobacteria bacterium RIFOXYA12_FULL_61_11]|nr:MAG: hypothetical protein A2284_03790 [Deltaproteobacteria bacterium RIFOXYA12_FULL_61_11]
MTWFAAWLEAAALVLVTAAFVGLLVGIMTENRRLPRGARWVETASILAMVLAVGLRWVEAGWLHPPVTTLRETLGLFVLAVLLAQRALALRGAGTLFGTVLALGGMLAMLLLDGSGSTALIPALRSAWLPVHVIAAVVGYSACIVAAGASLTYLLRSGAAFTWLRVLQVTAFAGIAYFVAERSAEQGRAGFGLAGSVFDGAAWRRLSPLDLGRLPGAFVELPVTEGVGTATLFLGLSFFGLFALGGRYEALGPWTNRAYKLFVVALSGTLSAFLAEVYLQPPRVVLPGLRVQVRLGSDPFLLAALVCVWAVGLVLYVMQFNLLGFLRALPDERDVERVAEGAVDLAVVGLGLVLVSGSLWAWQVWGRAWGWDPKESWTFCTWLVLVAHVHLRHSPAWRGKPLALLALLGLLGAGITYLGVGLLAGGLHTYAAAP